MLLGKKMMKKRKLKHQCFFFVRTVSESNDSFKHIITRYRMLPFNTGEFNTGEFNIGEPSSD
jgi:hypothetical protein